MSKRYRDYGLALLLLAGSLVLAVILAGEWLHYRGKAADLKKRLAEKVIVALPAPDGGGARYELPGLDQYGEMLERPLFMETRRPAEKEDNTPAPPPPDKTALSVKFMGALFAPDQTVGLFVDAKGKSRRRQPGHDDPIDGWTVVEIAPDKAIIEQGGVREELKLIKPKPKKIPGQLGPGLPAGQPPLRPAPPPPAGFNAPNNPPPEQAMEPEQPIEEPPPPLEEVPNE